MNTLHELEDMLYDELDKIVERKSVNQSNLEVIYKLTSALKNVKKIEMCDEKEYSGEDSSYRGYGSYSYDGDSMRGGYNRDGYSGRRYSRDDGMMSKIQEMLNDTHMSVEEKATLRRAMQMLNK